MTQTRANPEAEPKSPAIFVTTSPAGGTALPCRTMLSSTVGWASTFIQRAQVFSRHYYLKNRFSPSLLVLRRYRYYAN